MPLSQNVASELSADNVYAVGDVMSQIWDGINKAGVIVADLTGRNENVFYEVGICHALGKRVILLAQNINDVPFDLRSLRVIIYKYTPGGARELEKRLIATVENEISDFGSFSRDGLREFQAVFVDPSQVDLRPTLVTIRGGSEADAYDSAVALLSAPDPPAGLASGSRLVGVIPADSALFTKQ
jgi:hypothetical protein